MHKTVFFILLATATLPAMAKTFDCSCEQKVSAASEKDAKKKMNCSKKAQITCVEQEKASKKNEPKDKKDEPEDSDRDPYGS